MIGISVEPKSQADLDKLGVGLAKLAEEDPTFTVKTDEQTGQTVISGMGELHLEIIIDRLKREFKVECNQGRPQVAYREAISAPVELREVYKKQSGGRGKSSFALSRQTLTSRVVFSSKTLSRVVTCLRSTSRVYRRASSWL